MEESKFNIVLQYFDENNISLPTEVKNAIEDVFAENDNIEGVECYHASDLGEFEKDLTLHNDVSLSILGTNKGITNNVWTYYGNVTFALYEKIVLLDDNGEVLETISDLDPNHDTINELPNDFAVILVEKVEWDSSDKSFKRAPTLYIYCPKDIGDENEDHKYAEVYQQLKKEMGVGDGKL